MSEHSRMFSLAGRTALVTGGGSGLGLAIARCLAAAGARIVLLGRRKDPLAAATQALGERASWKILDLTDLQAIRPVARAIEEETGPVSILVNNAGIHLKRTFVDTDESELLRLFHTHVTGSLTLTRSLVPSLKASGHGSIVFISSMAALFGIPHVSAYTVAKSALTGAVRSLAVELGADSIRVNAVAPGWIDTSMSRRAFDGDPERKQRILQRTPLGRLGQADEVGWAVAYLCSPSAGFVTGAILPIDGGVSIGF